MASETPRKRTVRPLFLIYGVFALLISVALLGFILRGTLVGASAQPTPTHVVLGPPIPTPTEIIISGTPAQTVAPGTPTVDTVPTFAATATTSPEEPTPTPTGPFASFGNNSTTDNPLGLPTPVLAAIFAFTTLSGIASILKFTFDSLVAVARFVGRFRRP